MLSSHTPKKSKPQLGLFVNICHLGGFDCQRASVSVLYFEMPTCLRRLYVEKSHLTTEQWRQTLGTLIQCVSLGSLQKKKKKTFNLSTFILRKPILWHLSWRTPIYFPVEHRGIESFSFFFKAPNQLTQMQKSSQWMHECSCIHLPAEFLLCLGARVRLCENAINPGAVGFSARYGKIEAEYLFTAHPFKTWGLFLFVWLALRQGM